MCPELPAAGSGGAVAAPLLLKQGELEVGGRETATGSNRTVGNNRHVDYPVLKGFISKGAEIGQLHRS